MKEIHKVYKGKYWWMSLIFIVPFTSAFMYELLRDAPNLVSIFVYLSGLIMFTWLLFAGLVAKLEIKNEKLIFHFIHNRKKIYNISSFSEIRSIINFAGQICIFDMKGKVLIQDVSRYFSSNEEAREFVDLLKQINPNIIDDVKFDGIKGLMLYGKTK